MGELLNTTQRSMIGAEFITRTSGKCVVIDYKSGKDMTVAFYNPPYVTKCTMGNLRTGHVKNPYYPTLYGKGFIGIGTYSSKNRYVYDLWASMLKRAYSDKEHTNSPSYKDVEVCEEWFNFQNFAEWCYSQEFFGVKDDKERWYELDKDILVQGNKTYSPDKCCFVPKEVNLIFVNIACKDSKGSVGVQYIPKIGKFIARVSFEGKSKYLGSFRDLEDAKKVYENNKRCCFKEVADRWGAKLDERVYIKLKELSKHLDIDCSYDKVSNKMKQINLKGV